MMATFGSAILEHDTRKFITGPRMFHEEAIETQNKVSMVFSQRNSQEHLPFRKPRKLLKFNKIFGTSKAKQREIWNN